MEKLHRGLAVAAMMRKIPFSKQENGSKRAFPAYLSAIRLTERRSFFKEKSAKD